MTIRSLSHRSCLPPWLAGMVAMLCLSWPAGAAGPKISFDHLTPNHGLSQVSVAAILQDSQGFMWIGTQEGLNRYDGYEVRVFKHDPGDRASLSDNLIAGLMEDSSGGLWIITQQPGTLNHYDPATETFERLLRDPGDPNSLPDSNVNPFGLCEAEDGVLWVPTFGGGIRRIQVATGAMSALVTDSGDPDSLTDNAVSFIHRDQAGRIWVGTFGGGLDRWVPEAGGRGRFVHHRHDPDDPDSISDNVVVAVAEDESGRLWLGTGGSGLTCLDPQTGIFRHYPPSPTGLGGANVPFVSRPLVVSRTGHVWVVTNTGLSRVDPDSGTVRNYTADTTAPGRLRSAVINCVFEDSAGKLWVGSNGGGLARYDAEHDRFVTFASDPTDPGSFPSTFVATIYESRSGIVWFGTNSAGVSRYSPLKHKFRHYTQNGSDPDGLNDRMVFALLEDSAGSLWVGTMAGGLNRFDSDRERVVERYSLRPGSPGDVGSNYVRALLEDSQGRFWVGAMGAGVSELDRDHGEVVQRIRNVPGDPTSLSNNLVQSIFEDGQGAIWVGTANGWNNMDRDGTCVRYQNVPGDDDSLVNNFARFTFEDREGELWVGTLGGMSRFDRATGTFTNFTHDLNDPRSLSHNNVMDMAEDDFGFMWVATYGGGLSRFDRSAGTFTHFTSRDGLPSDAVYSVLAGDDGFFWLATNHGMCRFDPDSHTLVTYEASDGLQSNEFNGRSFFRCADGELLFGGTNGFNAFYPDEPRRGDYVPPVVLTGFSKLDTEVSFDAAIQFLDRIQVSYKDRIIAFEFAALDFTNPQRNQYAYMLEGLDDDWIPCGSRRTATYNHLGGGRYTFKVRGSSGDGVWNPRPASIELVVIPPPWKSPWAYALYGILAATALFGYMRFKTVTHERELDRNRQELARQLEVAEQLRQVDRLKDEFLANTSHELRTPLNGIIGIAESLIDGATGELPRTTRANLFMIASSGRRLSHLVDDILDFSKLKNRQITLQRRPVALREMVEVVLTVCEPLLGDTDLELANEVPEELPPADADENRLQQILHNLVGNAIKFTERGMVTVRAAQRDQVLEVAVSDTGIGIAEDKLQTIFEGFEQADASSSRSYGGTGLGLTISRQLVELHGGTIGVSSTPGEGSTFTFTVPVWSGDADDDGRFPDRERLARIRDLTGAMVGLPDAEIEDEPEPLPPAGAGEDEQEEAGGLVLAVDDEPINLQVLKNILTLARYEVITARDGYQCLEVLEGERRPDLVLLDVMMPRLTGFETARRIRQRWSANELPIILVTAKNQVADLVEGLTAGANDYLSKPFSKNELLARIRTHISLSRAHDIQAENRRKTVELEQARRIQLSMLPARPPRLPGLEIAVAMTTATEVGGDYYDFFCREDGSLFVVTGDATGHGMSAGMMVAMTKSALRALDIQSPHLLLEQLDGVIRAVNLERMRMAMNVAHIRDGELALSSAGMPPAYVYRCQADRVEEFLIGAVPLGGSADADYGLRVTELGYGDVLVLISDGLPERRNPADELLGYDAVTHCIARHGLGTAEEILSALLELGDQWAADHPQDDDITVLVVKRV